MKALLIEFNIESGKRAGDLKIKGNLDLFCHRGWQELDTIPAREIREVKDGRDISQYETIDGITPLYTNEEIRQALEQYIDPRYKIDNESLFQMSIDSKGIDVNDIDVPSTQELLEELYDRGVKGIKKIMYADPDDVE